MSVSSIRFSSFCSSVFKVSSSLVPVRTSHVASRPLSSLISPKQQKNIQHVVKQLDKIPKLSIEERATISNWYKFHEFVLADCSVNGKSDEASFLGSLFSTQLSFYYDKNCFQTSCGVTNEVVNTTLLGPVPAALKEINKQDAERVDVDFFCIDLERAVPTLYDFEISPAYVECADGSIIHTGGHAWTIFHDSENHFYLTTSYINQQQPAVIKLTTCEMQYHIEDVLRISNAQKWTPELDAVYKKWFGAQHTLWMGGMGFGTNNAWQVTFDAAYCHLNQVIDIDDLLTYPQTISNFPKNTFLDLPEGTPWWSYDAIRLV